MEFVLQCDIFITVSEVHKPRKRLQNLLHYRRCFIICKTKSSLFHSNSKIRSIKFEMDYIFKQLVIVLIKHLSRNCMKLLIKL